MFTHGLRMVGKNGDICTKCKGSRRLCGARTCPLVLKRKYLKKEIPKVRKRHVQAVSRPDFLVGEYGYPNINLGPLSTPTRLSSPYEDPNAWAHEEKDIQDVLKIRLSTLFTRKKARVRDARQQRKIQEMSISTKPLDIELGLKKRPKTSANLDAGMPSVGLSGELEKLEIVDTISAPRKLESAVEEDAKVRQIAPELWKHDISYYKIMRLLSMGMLGRKKDRKFVPTRWAITATDSTLGDYFLEQIRDFSSIGTGALYFRKYLGNLYYVMLVPSECWRMERFEIWLPNSVWTEETEPSVYQIHESYDGKATGMNGGYYATRFAILEHLAERRKKAAALVIRVITPAYYAPVGSWQIRESVRRALKKEPKKEGPLPQLIASVMEQERKRIRMNIPRRSWLLEELKAPTLNDFF